MLYLDFKTVYNLIDRNKLLRIFNKCNLQRISKDDIMEIEVIIRLDGEAAEDLT